MPKVRDVLIHVSVETAKGRRSCHRTDKPILKGESCLVIKTGPMRSEQSYERESAQQILDQAFRKMEGLYSGLGLSLPR